MVDTGCVEIVVNRKPNTLIKMMRISAIVLAVCFFILVFIWHFSALLGAAVFAALAWYLWLQEEIDYEYSYVDKELRVAKIMRKQRRREIGSYDLSSLEIMAPADSDALCPYRNSSSKVLDYASGEEKTQGRYCVILNDGTGLLLDLDDPYGQGDNILRAVRTFAPRKVQC